MYGICTLSVLLTIFVTPISSQVSGCNLLPVAGKPKAFLLCTREGCSSWSCIKGEVYNYIYCGCISERLVIVPKTEPVLQPTTTKRTTVLSTTTIATTTLAPETTTPATTTTTGLTRSPNCFTYPHPSDPTKYLQATVIGNITRNCAPGTQYVANICNCNFGFASRIKNKDCLPEVFISATSSIQSEGGYGPLWVDIKENVANQNGMAKFEGPDASIKIPRFNNVEYTDGLTITFRFQEQNKTPAHQVLVSNCVNPIGPSIEISINTDSNLATFSATIGDQGVKSEITIPYTPNEMKQIVMIHDGRAMTGFVGTARNTTTLRGYIQPRSVALHFGNSPCDSYQGFQGVMDDIRVYRCVDLQLASGPSTPSQSMGPFSKTIL